MSRSHRIATLTLAEKAALLSGRDFWSTQPFEQHDIASVVVADGPHGVRRQVGDSDHLGLQGSEPATCFPPAVAVGSSWNPRVAEQIGEAIGREARAQGVQVILGPGVNIKRSPLCGRNFEYYSEDPLLSGELGAAQVLGLASQGVGASVKHFAANNQETERMRVSADVDERTLREIYLPAFERVVTRANPATVMSAYNRVNGTPAAENRWLLTGVLRGEWGFNGAVVSDWGGVLDPVASLRAGLDLEMPGTRGASAQAIVDAVHAGDLDESLVDQAAERVLALGRLIPDETGSFDADTHHALARALAAECIVLLKNDDDTLPLVEPPRIAVIGEFARTPRFQAGGSSRVNATRVDVPLDSIQALAEERGSEMTFEPGFSLENSSDELIADAVQSAAACDVAVVFAGLAEPDESEGFDRTHLELPSVQVELIRAVAAAAPRTVVVLANGGIVTVEGWHECVDAIVEGFLLGQAGGAALADVLFGVVNPSGHLAESVPMRLADTASYATFPGEQGHSRYGEGTLVGYRWHESMERPTRYAFGHGLSYTTFESSDLDVYAVGADEASVSVTVRNAGERAGSHVVQVYVATSAGPVRRPAREFRAFAKIHVDPGESRTVQFHLDRRAFAYWDVKESGWVVAPGSYTVQVCRDAATVLLEQDIELTGDHIVRELSPQSTVEEWFSHPVVGPRLHTALAGGSTAGAPSVVTPGLLQMIGSMPMKKVIDMLGEAVPTALFDSLMGLSRQATNHSEEKL